MKVLALLLLALGLALTSVACGGSSSSENLGSLEGTEWENQPVFAAHIDEEFTPGADTGPYTSAFVDAIKACGFDGVDEFAELLGQIAPGTDTEHQEIDANGTPQNVSLTEFAEYSANGGWSGRVEVSLDPDPSGAFRSVIAFEMPQVASGIFEFTCIEPG